MSETISPLNLAVFVGSRGRGSNLMALHAAAREGRLSARIAVVVGSKSDAPALDRARDAGLPVAVIGTKDRDEATYGEILLTRLRRAGADAIALAGYMRRLPLPVVNAYRSRIVNVHPALLPAFGGQGMYGLHVHQAVLDYGCKVSGCTVHFVDESYDTGPVIVQRVVAVADDDTAETLAARVLTEEHAAFVDALQLLAEDRLRVVGRRVRVL